LEEVPTNSCGSCEKESCNKIARGKPPSVGHFHEEVSPTHFYKLMMSPRIGMLSIPDTFRTYLAPQPERLSLVKNEH
jgi:hypothetical protein